MNPETRSRMMAGIGSKHTQPELSIRQGLHATGFRFRLHAANLPGKPDLVLPKYHAAIFVNGCFWHGHNCHLFKMPSTRPEFWRQKIESNIHRGEIVGQQLSAEGWRIAIIWECSLKGRSSIGIAAVILRIAEWLKGSGQFLDIRGA